MSDIVERLATARNMSELERAAADAIDEIERLQKDVVHWREARRSCIEAGDMMKAEIEQQRKELNEVAKLNLELMDIRAKQDAEIGRLRSARNELVTALYDIASHFENTLYAFRDDTEARKKAEGDIAHAMKIAARHNRNGREALGNE
jgi:chromosome segregation ATPase